MRRIAPFVVLAGGGSLLGLYGHTPFDLMTMRDHVGCLLGVALLVVGTFYDWK